MDHSSLKIDPFTREQISPPSRSLGIESMVHPIMKSSLGLDTFMKYKVEQFFKKLQVLNKAYHSSCLVTTRTTTTSTVITSSSSPPPPSSTTTSTTINTTTINSTKIENDASILRSSAVVQQHTAVDHQDSMMGLEKDSFNTEILSHVFKLMIRFISSCLLYMNTHHHHGGNNSTPLPDHYHIAKNELPKYVTLFDKQELLETCLEECKHSQNVFNLISEFINESFARNSPTNDSSPSTTTNNYLISTRMNRNLLKSSSDQQQQQMKEKNLVSLMDNVLSPLNSSSPTLIQQAFTNSSPLIAVMNVKDSLLTATTSVNTGTNTTNTTNTGTNTTMNHTTANQNLNNIWITIPPIEMTSCVNSSTQQQHLDSYHQNIISSLFSDEIFSHIPNTNQVLNLSSLRSLSHYLFVKNNQQQQQHTHSMIKEYSDSHVKYTILKQGIVMKKDVKSFFQNSKLKKRHILLTVNAKSKFKVLIFNADGNNNDIFHSDMKPLEEMELSNLCYITINDQPKKNSFPSNHRTLTLNDRTEKKKWLFEFENSYERDEWLYLLKYCLLLC